MEQGATEMERLNQRKTAADKKIENAEKTKNTQLHLALKENKIIDDIISIGFADINTVNQEGFTPFHLAAKNARLDVIEAMLDEDNIEINKKSTSKPNNTCLHFAVSATELTGVSEEIVELLLDHGEIDTSVKNIEGATALELAVLRDGKLSKENITIISMLFEAEMKLDKFASDLDKIFKSIIIIDKEDVLIEVLGVFIAAENDVIKHIFDTYGDRFMEIVSKIDDTDSLTLLEKNIALGNWSVVEQLKQKGAELQKYSLHKIIIEKDIKETAAAFEIISVHFSSIDEYINTPGEDGLTPLHLAAKYNRIAALKYLLEMEEIEINKVISVKKSEKKKLPEVGQADLNNDESQNIDSDGEDTTALDLAVEYGHTEAVKLLLDRHLEIYYNYRSEINDCISFQKAVKLCNGEQYRTNIALMFFNAQLDTGDDDLSFEQGFSLKYIAKYAPNNDLLSEALKLYCKLEECNNGHEEHLNVFNKLLYTNIKKCDFKFMDYFLQQVRRPKVGVMHELIRQSVDKPHLIEEIKSAYRLIVKYSSGKSVTFQDEELKSTKERMMELLYEDTVDDMDVLEYACSKGATDMVEEILNTEGVMYWGLCSRYDVTNLRPKTLLETKNTSLLELLFDSSSKSDEEELAVAQLIGKEPFNSLVSDYFAVYRRFNMFLLVFHILYMSLFTWCLTFGSTGTVLGPPKFDNQNSTNESFFTSNNSNNSNNSNTSNCLTDNLILNEINKSAKIFCFVVWFSWPILNICLNMFEIIETLSHSVKAMRDMKKYVKNDWERRWDTAREKSLNRKNIIIRYSLSVLKLIPKCFSDLFSLTFAAIALSWLVYYYSPNCLNYVWYLRISSAVLIFGWVDTLNYICVIWQPIMNLLVMIKRIFVKDFVSFMIVYIFFYIGFAISYHIFAELEPNSSVDYYDPALTYMAIFSVNNLALVTSSAFNTGEGIHSVTAIVSVYCGITYIVLSNLLIAMVNQSYSDISEIKRVQKQCLRLELTRKSLWLSKLKHFFTKCRKCCKSCKSPNACICCVNKIKDPGNKESNGNEESYCYKGEDGRHYMEKRKKYRLRLCVDPTALRSWIVH